MESTAQYWRPVWMALEGEFRLTLAQARSTRGRRGRKWDKADARRIAKRLLSGDLTPTVAVDRMTGPLFICATTMRFAVQLRVFLFKSPRNMVPPRHPQCAICPWTSGFVPVNGEHQSPSSSSISHGEAFALAGDALSATGNGLVRIT